MSADVDRGNILSLLKENGLKNSSIMKKCDWNVEEIDFFWDSLPKNIEQIVQESEVVLAADVVYDREITSQFFKTLKMILSLAPKIAIVAIEKRQRAGNEGSIIAPNFEYFLENLSHLNNLNLSKSVKLKVSQVDINFPQFFTYSRVLELTLWKIESLLIDE